MLLAFGPFQDLDLFNYLGNEIVEAQGLTKESRCKYLLLLLCKTHYNSCSRASFFFFFVFGNNFACFIFGIYHLV